MRRDFVLPAEDRLFLDNLMLEWEAVSDQGMQWVIIYKYPVCKGYKIDKVDVAIKVETGYPRSALDMAYFYPAIERKDGQPIRAVTSRKIDGKIFQRWSRHRTALNPWREGLDDLSTHLGLVSFWFEQEFKKNPNGIHS